MRLPWTSGPLNFWRIDLGEYGGTWDLGRSAEENGGRWNPVGFPAVYCSADPATAILEVAANRGFKALDAAPHVLTSAEVLNLEDVHVLRPEDVPNPLWLLPASVSGGQQAFGQLLLQRHAFVLVPSTVTRESWNVLFNPDRARDRYRLSQQKPFALDPRLNPPHKPTPVVDEKQS